MSSTGSQPTARLRRRAGQGLVGTTRRAHQEFRRATKNPFTFRVDPPMLVHCGHHKSGTVWFREVLLSVIGPYGLRFHEEEGHFEPIRPHTGVAFYSDSGMFQRDQLENRKFRGSHLIRDPRDLVVSAYEYHLVTSEAWACKPRPRLGGLSYQGYLKSLCEHDGLMAEIQFSGNRTIAAMAAWEYDQPEFLELRYEDAIADEQGTFERVFRWYGFNDTAIRIGLESVDRLSLKRGGARPNHARSGAPGEWRSRMGPEHIARFKEVTGDLAFRLGYETEPDW